MDGRTRFPSKIYFSFDRSFVRSFDPRNAGRRRRRKGRPRPFVALPTCGNLPVAASLPPSVPSSHCLSQHWHLSPFPSLPLSPLLFGSWPECSSLLASGHGTTTAGTSLRALIFLPYIIKGDHGGQRLGFVDFALRYRIQITRPAWENGKYIWRSDNQLQPFVRSAVPFLRPMDETFFFALLSPKRLTD